MIKNQKNSLITFWELLEFKQLNLGPSSCRPAVAWLNCNELHFTIISTSKSSWFFVGAAVAEASLKKVAAAAASSGLLCVGRLWFCYRSSLRKGCCGSILGKVCCRIILGKGCCRSCLWQECCVPTEYKQSPIGRFCHFSSHCKFEPGRPRSLYPRALIWP